MSKLYNNSFIDGPNDKKKPKKPIRTNHPTWTDIFGLDGRRRKKDIDTSVKEAGG